MSLKEAVLNLKIQPDFNNKVDIGLLNDKCLIYIFQLLSLKDRLTISLVCKRWNQIISDSWKDVKSFKLDDDFRKSYLSDLESKKSDNANLVINILRNCGPYLNELTIDTQIHLDLKFPRLFKEISRNCSNIIDLNLIDKETDNTIKEEYLELLFNSNKFLSNLHLENLSFSGSCFLNINTNLIKQLTLINCQIDSAGFLYGFIYRLKNLTKFIFHPRDIDHRIGNAVDSLFMNGCEEITEFSISSYRIYKILNLLSRQKKLSHIGFDFSKPELWDNEELFSNLPTDNLEKISDLYYDEKYSIHFHRFNNLKYFSCIVDSITDKFILALSKFKNLKEIEITVIQKNLITPIGYSNFSKLTSLTKFSYKKFTEHSSHYSNAEDADNLLISLAKCKNLKNIVIRDQKFTGIGIRNISTLPNLTEICLTGNHVTDEMVIHLIKNSLNLKKIDVGKCDGLSNKLIKSASDLIDNRKDKHILKIVYSNSSDINLESLDNLSALIKLEKYHRKQ